MFIRSVLSSRVRVTFDRWITTFRRCRRRRLPQLFLAILYASVSFAQTPVELNGRLKVRGLQLCNQAGKAIQLRGMSTWGLQWSHWGDCINESSLDALAYQWGADVFRIGMYVQEGGWSKDPAKFTAYVDRLVDEVRERGMYAIIDFHTLTPGDPNENTNNAKTFFEHMASTHGAKGHVIYEICNEPNGEHVNWARIKTYADQVIPVIRKHDSAGVILVGTPGWSSLGVSQAGPWTDIVKNKIPDPNVMYVFHFYAASHKENYRDAVRKASAELPLFCSEFSYMLASGDGNCDWVSSRAWMELMEEKKISWAHWMFSDHSATSAVLTDGTCPNGPWVKPRLKPTGDTLFKWMSTPDDFSGAGVGDNQLKGPQSITGFDWEGADGNLGVEIVSLDGKVVTRGKGPGMRPRGLRRGIYLERRITGGVTVARTLFIR